MGSQNFTAGLQTSVQTTYSNNGSTTILGRAAQKTINSSLVIGPPLTQFIDVETLAGFVPTYSYYNPTTGHLFVLGPVSATPTVALFTFNNLTGAYAYVGKVTVTLGNAAATTYVFRGFTVYEKSGLIYLIISATGSVVINGGTYVAWGLSTSQFTVGGSAIFAASGSAQNAVYFLQDPSAMGVASVLSSPWGNALPQFSATSSVNTKVWQFNGTLALPVLYSWDLSLTPTVAGIITNGVSAQTTLYAGTSPSAFFTMGASQNGYSLTNGDAVVLMTGTGGVPSGFAAWTAGTAQVAATNVYFMRDLQLVSGNYYFNLSSTSGGAAITPTSSTSSFTMLRAFGINTSLFSLKTGTLPAFTLGTILQSDSVGYAQPVSAPANTALNGQDCLYMATTTGLYMGKISDLGSLGTTWASMTFSGVNTVGTGIDYVAGANVFATYCGANTTNDIDRWLFVQDSSTVIMKPYQNSNISGVFGGTDNSYYEGLNPITVDFGATGLNGVNAMGGWLFACANATVAAGQRGIFFLDLYSDTYFGNSAAITPVLNVPPSTTFRHIFTDQQLWSTTSNPILWIRSATTSTSSTFSTASLPSGSGVTSNGWTQVYQGINLSAYAIGPCFQLCVTFEIIGQGVNTPAQIQELFYSVDLITAITTNWEGSVDNSTQSGASPMYVAFRMTSAYASSVPTLYVRGTDDSGNVNYVFNTVTNASVFSYTTNNGTSWNTLGTIPNTPLTTEVRVQVASPSGTRLTWSIGTS